MISNRRSITQAICALMIYLGTFGIALAEKAALRPQPPLNSSQEREDYQECTRAVLSKYRGVSQAKRAKRIQRGISACRDRYPAVSIMVECKREMTQAYRDNHEDLKLALKQCRTEYQKYTFNPKLRIPFLLREDQAFFAGAGLNRSLPVKKDEDDSQDDALYMGEDFGNFSCSPLQAAMFEGQTPEFILFGNDPLLFTPLRHANREVFLQTLGFAGPIAERAAPTTQTIINRDLGELIYDPDTRDLIAYPPVSHCFFNRKLGSLFEGIKIYFLLDQTARQVTPYFGVAFYKAASAPRPDSLAEDMRRLLGQEYQRTQPKPGVYLVSQGQVEAFDSEGDPKNICGSDQVSPYMAIVHSEAGSGRASYALLANTANLCRYGDRMASRFLKRGLNGNPTPP